MLRMLTRLADESHLLPEYPLLAHRFKHTTTTSTRQPAEIVTLAEGWAFASRAAREDQQESVDGKTALGLEIVQKERDDAFFGGQDLLEEDDDLNTEGGRDIWVESAALQLRRRRRRTGKSSPWSRLEGRIGA